MNLCGQCSHPFVDPSRQMQMNFNSQPSSQLPPYQHPFQPQQQYFSNVYGNYQPMQQQPQPQAQQPQPFGPVSYAMNPVPAYSFYQQANALQRTPSVFFEQPIQMQMPLSDVYASNNVAPFMAAHKPVQNFQMPPSLPGAQFQQLQQHLQQLQQQPQIPHTNFQPAQFSQLQPAQQQQVVTSQQYFTQPAQPYLTQQTQSNYDQPLLTNVTKGNLINDYKQSLSFNLNTSNSDKQTWPSQVNTTNQLTSGHDHSSQLSAGHYAKNPHTHMPERQSRPEPQQVRRPPLPQFTQQRWLWLDPAARPLFSSPSCFYLTFTSLLSRQSHQVQRTHCGEQEFEKCNSQSDLELPNDIVYLYNNDLSQIQYRPASTSEDTQLPSKAHSNADVACKQSIRTQSRSREVGLRGNFQTDCQTASSDI